VCCQLEVSATSWSLVQRSPTDCGARCGWSRNLVNEEALARWGLLCQRQTKLFRCSVNNLPYSMSFCAKHYSSEKKRTRIAVTHYNTSNSIEQISWKTVNRSSGLEVPSP